MSTAIKQSEKLLAYDGDCPMCLATVSLLTRLRLVRPEQTRSNHDLDGADLEAARRAGIRNQLVVIDPQTRETRAGSDGLLWIIGDNTGQHLLVRLLSLPGFRHLLRYGYETVSYNRRVISPPRHQIVCDCEPEVTLARRLALVVPLLIIVVVIVAGFGAAAFSSFAVGDALAGAVYMPLAVLAPWAVLAAAGLVCLKGIERIDYVAHLTVTLLTGALMLVPAALLAPIVPRGAWLALSGALVPVGFGLMFLMQRRRVAAMRLSRAWLWAWTLVVPLGWVAAALLYR